jgi:uncharacterized membrane protein
MNLKSLTIFLSILSLLSSFYLFWKFEIKNNNSGFFCNVNQIIDCSKINLSNYAYFLGIPFSLWGIFYFTFLLILLWQKDKLKKILFFYSLLGILFLPYFIYAEIKLKAICPFCFVVYLTLIFLLIYSWQINKSRN